MALNMAIFACGLGAWTFLEYVIHGWMSHVFVTFVSPLHDAHHREPARVFATGAWIPALVLALAGLWRYGWAPGVIFYLGILCGFIVYELVHYRIHFARPATRFEARLRARHLAHHLRRPDALFGVTTPLWDRIFGSEPAPDEMTRLGAVVRDVAPLVGASNFRRIFYLGIPAE